MEKNEISIQELLDFAQSRDRNEEYKFHDVHDCFLCRFAKSRGFEGPIAGADFFYVKDRNGNLSLNFSVPKLFGSGALNNKPQNMGGAAQRLRQLAASTPAR